MSEDSADESESSWSYRDFPRRVNLGCGWDKRDGYLNIDMNAFHQPDLIGDVTRLVELPDAYYEEVLAIDVLEHIPRLRCVSTLLEWNRILAVGGVLRLQVPNLVGLLGLMTEPGRQSIEQQELLTQCLFGTQAYNGDFHFNGFTEVTLHSRLRSAGFTVSSLSVRDGWLFEVEAVKTSSPVSEPWMQSESAEEFITTAYHVFLDRAPDPGGAEYFLDLLKNGTDRYVIMESLRTSDEAKARQRASVE